jgi:cytochrome b6-f complex iron-sulfur subunit
MNFFSRRDFLKLSTNTLLGLSGLLGLGGVLRYLVGYADETEQPQIFDLGPAENYPLGSRTVVANGRFVLIHDDEGLSTINTTCTHLGCQVTPGPNGFTCPCHGSHFDLQGSVVNGPATKALGSQPVEPADDGRIILHIP